MADILVFNALKDVESALNVENGLAVKSVSGLKIAIENTIDNTDYHNAADVITLEKLSCNQLIATCACNYCGSGTVGYCNNSPWQVELASNSINTMYERLVSKVEMDGVLGEIDDLSSTVLKNNIKQFIELYARDYIEKSQNKNDLISYWFRSGFLTSVKVCSSNYKQGEGATCTWTVPDDAATAKFQVWGAGPGTNPGCCCGGSSFGANGAYSELTIGVTPGDTYTICAGCSCSINCCSNTWPGCACMSGVTGNGICCLKSDGGSLQNCGSLNGVRTSIGAGGTCQRYANPYCTDSGPCWCNYGEYCFDNSCATCGIVPVHADCCSGRTYCACGTDTAEVSKGGYRPIHGGGCLDTNNYGNHTRPPILDSDTCSIYTAGCRCAYFTSNCCCGGINGDNWDRHPGMGGAYTHTMNSNNNHLGGKGTGGMVKVSWK